ncbi:transketolase [bacterium]|nr:transketolase [bacterium]
MNEIAKKIRRKVIDLLYRHKAAHLGSCMSCIEILVVLYFNIMREEDKFLLSKGWAAAALYSVLSEKGIIDWDDLYKNYYEVDSKYWGLVHHSVPGVEHSLGSAGHGLPVAIGMALADKRRRIFVLLSDGEMDCGTTWESALFASHHKLDNLMVLVDYNKLQAFGRTNEVLNLEPLKDKWNSFGWDVKEVDGHNTEELRETILESIEVKGRPHIIICHTIKGKGISFAENKVEWHYYNLTPELYERAKRDLR